MALLRQVNQGNDNLKCVHLKTGCVHPNMINPSDTIDTSWVKNKK